MAEGLFIHSHNEISDRFAILDETEKIAFLYLTKQGSQKPEKDAIAYMRIDPPENVDWKTIAEAGFPPVFSAEFASLSAVIRSTKKSDFSFGWSKDGDATVLLYNNQPIVFVTISERLGYSRAVSKENKLTNPWNEDLYGLLFSK